MTRQDYTQHRTKRTYSRKFKAELVSQCLSGDVSVASLATEHGMNQNVLHRWLSEYRRYGMHDISSFDDDTHLTVDNIVPGSHNWLSILPQKNRAVSVPKTATPANKSSSGGQPNNIALEISSDKLKLNLSWPNTDHSGLASFIKELLV